MHFLHRASLPLLSLLLVSACSLKSEAPRGGENTEVQRSAIQGGTVANTQTFAVALFGRGMCSGTLIAPNLVLTARHCVEIEPSSSESGCEDGVLLKPSDMRVTTAAFFNPSGPWTSVVKILPAPAQNGCDPDMALVQLGENIAEEDAKPVKPAVDAAYLSRPNFSEVVTAIGHGLDDEGNSGRRRIRENIQVLCAPGDKKLECPPEVEGYVQKFEFIAGEGACQGDSGGGLYDQESFDAEKPIVVGVVSRGPVDEEGRCGPGLYVRVDKFSEFVIGAAKEAAKDGKYAPPEWAGGGPAPQAEEPPQTEAEPPAEEPPPPPAPVTKTTTTTTTGCASAPGSTGSTSAFGFLGVALAFAVARRKKV